MAGSLDEQQLISALVQEMPIFTLIQPSLYEKLTNLAKGRGYDVPEEESSDSVIFDNPSYAVEEQSDVETVDMDQLPIASIVSPTDKSGSDETKAVS